MSIILNTYQFANDDGTVASALVSTGTNTLGMAARQVRGVPRSVALPFPNIETIQSEVYQFVFAFGYTGGTPTQYPGIYGTVHVRIFDGTGTLLEWDASATNPIRATTVGLVGDDNLSAFTSTLTPSQTPVANVRGVNLSSLGGFDSSRYVAAQSNPASKKMTAYRSTSSNGNFYWFIYSDPFSMNIPDNAFVEAQVTKLLDNTNSQSFVELALYNSAGRVMNLSQFGGTSSIPNIRGTTPADQSYTASPIATVTTLSAGFYWQDSDGVWQRVNDYSTVGGTINDRLVDFGANGSHDVYGYNVNSSGIAIFTLLQVTTSGLVLKNPFFVHPAGFQVSAIKSASDTKIESWETFSNKTLISTMTGVVPRSIYRLKNGEIHFLGKTSSGSAFYVSYDEGVTWTQMATPFDSTFETYDGCPIAGPGDMAVATKAGQLYVRTSGNLSTWAAPAGFTPITLPSGFKPITARQRYINGLVSIIITDSSTFQYETINDGSIFTVIT